MGNLRIAVAVAACGILLAGRDTGRQPAETTPGLRALRIMSGEYPRAYFFRASESPGKNPDLTYEQWEKTFGRLMGIEGKALDEEIPGLSKRNIEFFTRFKKRHPDQLVLLHFNGNARDPRYRRQNYFAGHWIYFNGARILSDVPAQEGETEIRVSDPALFKTGVGRYRNKNEDVGLCLLDENGKPDWNESEQVQLIRVDAAKGTIRVQRGCYGTRPRAFPAGKAYAAAHISEGPWGEKSNLLWFYNYSTAAPKDARGRSAADVLIDELVRQFSPGGELAAFDGIEFDVLFFLNRYHRDLRNRNSRRGMDIDGDTKIDQGVVGGLNTYGIGVVEFCRRLRQRFPAGKLLLADGMGETNQRAFHILNGIESEGFPRLSDLTMRDWSGGLNRHFFWKANARPPVFNYVNHKYVKRDPKTGLPRRPDIPFGIHRLAFAAAVFTDSAICYSFAPEAEPGEQIGIWDEFRKGTAHELGWLGKPVGPPVRLAAQAPDLLKGRGKHLDNSVLARFQGSNARFALEGNAVKITGTDGNAAKIRFRLLGVPARGPDLFVTFDVRGAGREGYPPEVARLMHVKTAGEASPGFMTWVGRDSFRPAFYFSDVKSDKVDLDFEIEGCEPLWISNISVHAHPDAMYREFEHGLVVANPAPHPYTLPLGQLFPGKSFRRLRGSPGQDTAANNGGMVDEQLQLGAKDALFLVRVN